jgi:hypothetical protein
MDRIPEYSNGELYVSREKKDLKIVRFGKTVYADVLIYSFKRKIFVEVGFLDFEKMIQYYRKKHLLWMPKRKQPGITSANGYLFHNGFDRPVAANLKAITKFILEHM